MSRRLAQGVGDPPPRGTRAVIALGANLGDRAETLDQAREALAHLPLSRLVAASPTVETIAVTVEGEDPDAPRYLNAVAEIETRLSPSVLLGWLHLIERDHGRVRDRRWGDRTLDLDIVTYGDLRVADALLALPHPRAHEREFVLAPWVAMDPDAELPGRGRVDALLAGLRGES